MAKNIAKQVIPYTIDEAMHTPNVPRYNNLENFASPIYYCVENTMNRSSYDVMEDICKKFQEEKDNCIMFKITLKELCDLVTSGYLKLNRKNKAHEIPVQRGDVTAPSAKSKIIVGLINKDNTMPVLDMQAFIDKTTGEICIKPQDGNQRCNSIYDYIVGDMKLCGTGTILDGTVFRDLPASAKKAIEGRTVYVKILEKGCDIQFAARFKILNTTQTKMSSGELLNTTNSENEAYQKARELMRTNKSVNMIYGKTSPMSPVIKEDTRMLNMSRFAFSVCSTYLMNTSGIVNGAKHSSLNKLVDDVMSTAMNDNDVMDDLNNLFEVAPSVCKNIEKYFGAYFCNILTADTIATTSRKTYIRVSHDDCKHFVPGYKHYDRHNSKRSQSIQSIVFYITFRLMSAGGKMLVSDDAMREIVTNIDNMIGDSDYHDAYEEHKGSAYTGKRIEYIMSECVAPVCAKYGATI